MSTTRRIEAMGSARAKGMMEKELRYALKCLNSSLIYCK